MPDYIDLIRFRRYGERTLLNPNETKELFEQLCDEICRLRTRVASLEKEHPDRTKVEYRG